MCVPSSVGAVSFLSGFLMMIDRSSTMVVPGIVVGMLVNGLSLGWFSFIGSFSGVVFWLNFSSRLLILWNS